MKQRLLLLFAFLVAMTMSSWADDLPSPVYFNDFKSAEGLTVVGNGTFELTPDPRFGKVFHNDPTVTKAIRTNWLELPSDIFSHSSQTKEMTIGFWVNKMTATDYFFSPLFTAYGDDNVNKSHQWEDSGWPFFCLETRGLLRWNSEGWCDFTAEQNDAGTNKESTVWTDDGKWHYVTMTFTTSKAVVYIDGEVLNSWTIADEGLAGLFTQTSLTHFCLGGNQAFGWNDPDPAFAFDNFAVYDQALSASQIKQVMAAAEPAYSDATTPLTIEGTEDVTTVTFTNNSYGDVQCSYNYGAIFSIPSGVSMDIILNNAGDIVQFWGDNETYYYNDNSSNISCDKPCYVYGNIMSLVSSAEFATKTDGLGMNAFSNLFNGNTNLLNHAEKNLVLPATTLAGGCYENMFKDCTGLTAAPALPATNLAFYCYNGMFSGCTGLTAAPELPATTLTSSCYGNMFNGCTGLTAAPELPATTLANYCYSSMFEGCTGLTAAPKLPAMTLTDWCYRAMFYGCTGLTAAPALPATTLANGCYYAMFMGCTSLTAAPELPAATLAENCYGSMFDGSTNLAAVTCLATDFSATDCTTNWLKNVAATGTLIVANEDIELPGVPAGWKQVDFAHNTPLTIEATSDGTIKVDIPKTGMKYSLNGGAKTTMDGTTEINVTAGDKVQFYGNGTSITKYSGTRISGGTATCIVYGNIMSLVNENNFATATTLANAAFYELFYYNKMLTDASGLLLPATTLANGCYYAMFEGCTGLTAAPALPATTLDESCYNRMFNGCISLTAAPELPATTLAEFCYDGMFHNCTGLTAAPALPATNLAFYCYYGMFMGCTGLTAAPELPATTLAAYCYEKMFSGCTGLTSAPALPATTLAEECYYQMFSGCTSLTAAPVLPATTLAEECYLGMFVGCTSLTSVPALPATTLAESCYSEMFHGCTSLSAAPELPATTLANYCYRFMFMGCTSLTTAPALPGTTLANYCYAGMFDGCTALTAAPALPATTLAYFCYYGMFDGCTALTAAPALPGTTLAEGCYTGMFTYCESLTAAPALPATTLAAYCYNAMFYGCTNLSSVTCLATDISATSCTADWLTDVAATGTFIAANNTVAWVKNSSSGIPTGWNLSPACTPLTIEGTEDGTIVSFDNHSSGPVHYIVNNGVFSSISSQNSRDIYIGNGDIIQFYGDNASYGYESGSIKCNKPCYVYGNIMSLISSTDFASNTVGFTNDDVFCNLFANNTNIRNHAEKNLLLPATTLSNYCYERMFRGCTGLTTAPVLPATTLANSCYAGMFDGCTGLTEAPALPSTTLEDRCYVNMFKGCTGLTTAPVLPATTLRDYCYAAMFSGCTGLTAAPELPATKLKGYCYYEMFKGCTNLSSVTCLATDISATICTKDWLNGVAATGTFTGANNTVAWVKDSESGVPTGWTYNIMVCNHVAGEPQVDDASKVDPTCTEDGSYDEVVYCTVCQAELSRTTYNIEPLGHSYGANGICSRCGETMPGVAPALTIEATSDGTIKVNYPKPGMKYSLNGGAKTAMSGTTEINVTAGDKVRFYGDGTNITSYDGTTISGGTAECKVYGNIMSLVDEGNFTTATTLAGYAFTGLFYENTKLTDASGLLLPATTLAEGCYRYMFFRCTGLTAAPELPATTLAEECYYAMFVGCTGLTAAPELPATTLAETCYYGMFSGCTSLTAAPELPATTLADDCYSWMFSGCTSLTAAPELPVTTLAKECYSAMFLGCTALTAAPALPATTLANVCYGMMFMGCTGLTVAPELPATKLVEGCYGYMFSGCTNLSSVTCLATDISATDCTKDWLKDVAATGVFTPANGDVAWVKDSPSGIPTGWTIYMGPTVNTPLTITAKSAGTIVVKDAKDGMRYTLNGGETTIMKGTTTISVATGDRVQLYGNGTRISSYSGTRIIGGTATFAVEGNIMSLVNEENFANATILSGPEAFMALFKDNTKLTDISGLLLPAVKLGASSYNQMFSGCTGLTKAPALPATELGEFCYSGMFSGCTGLTAAPALPATKMADGCYNQMFKGCTALTAAPALPATELAINCYNQMFYGCTALTAAPALPAMTVEILSYNEMFKGCTGLTAAPALPATTLAVECYFAMFEGCTGLTAAPALPAATLAEACYGSMFKGCTGLTKAPVLPAAKLVKGCYQHMFQGCAELAAVTCLATDISAENCTYQWLEGVAGTGAFTPANETVAWEKNSNSGIPTGWSGGPATGLNSVNADAKDAVIYDLMGRKVTNARRGMYILNGKKVVRK